MTNFLFYSPRSNTKLFIFFPVYFCYQNDKLVKCNKTLFKKSLFRLLYERYYVIGISLMMKDLDVLMAIVNMIIRMRKCFLCRSCSQGKSVFTKTDGCKQIDLFYCILI